MSGRVDGWMTDGWRNGCMGGWMGECVVEMGVLFRLTRVSCTQKAHSFFDEFDKKVRWFSLWSMFNLNTKMGSGCHSYLIGTWISPHRHFPCLVTQLTESVATMGVNIRVGKPRQGRLQGSLFCLWN